MHGYSAQGSSFLPDPTEFLDQTFALLQENGYFEVPFLLDHICYRVATPERYTELKTALLKDHQLVTESLINGRPIAVFRLCTPFVYGERRIELLELPSPKPGSNYPEGYEHVEFAIGEHPASWLAKYPQLNWDTKGLGKAINPDLRLPLGKGTSVKFHEHPLDYVIEHLDQ